MEEYLQKVKCTNMYKYVQICTIKKVNCTNMYKYVQICTNKMYKYVQICTNMYKYVQICTNNVQIVYKYVQMCTNTSVQIIFVHIWTHLYTFCNKTLMAVSLRPAGSTRTPNTNW